MSCKYSQSIDTIVMYYVNVIIIVSQPRVTTSNMRQDLGPKYTINRRNKLEQRLQLWD